jgi:cytochrome o ubiquinol oxidase operon protein cyoD
MPSLTPYIVGFGLSLALTFLAYFLANGQAIERNLLIGLLAILAFSQFVVQMVCFLHLGSERKPRWKFMVFLFLCGVVFMVVAGSIWIMYHLNYNMMRMDRGEQKTYLHQSEGL